MYIGAIALFTERRYDEIAEEIEVAYQYKYKEQSDDSCGYLIGAAKRGDTQQSAIARLLHQSACRAEEFFCRYVA